MNLPSIYFDQHRYAAGRGYGYVGISRFRSRRGCFLYGKLRQTDFLPVGEEKEDEVLERGYLSLSDSDEDGPGLEHAFSESIFDAFDVEENTNECVDFGDGLEVLSDPFADVDMTQACNQTSVDFE